MATAGKFNGNILEISFDGTVLTHALQHSESHSMSPIDVTTKDSSSQEEVIAGLRGSEISASGYFDEDAAKGYEDLYILYAGGNSVTVLVSTGVTGDVTYSYTAYITSLSRTAEMDTAVAFEVSLKPTGAVSKGVVA
jgi:predicted secreted protein